MSSCAEIEVVQLKFLLRCAGSGAAPTGLMDDAQKIALVKLEVERVQRLPASSAYAIHRLKVLNKMLELLSKVIVSLFSHSFRETLFYFFILFSFEMFVTRRGRRNKTEIIQLTELQLSLIRHDQMRRLPSWRRCLLNLRSENQTLP